ncbi:MAG TPA: GatB/YqeY domain-containing protein [Gemmatimonadales bacterium]|nr:GatB/YqeY domain-containing protein [Gemmatimonadales bacterium]HRZ09381.1 GatB/YqeY domain-containing protein [Gemmatimonadales bacterium]
MSNLADDLHAALTAARKSKNKDRTQLLGTVLAALKNRELEQNRAPTDEDVLEVLQKGVKTRRESVEQYVKGGREDLADQERAEIKIIEEYLPPAADPEEIRTAVRAAIAGGATDIGKVMGRVVPQFKGRADGKVIQQIVRTELSLG